MRWAGEVLVPFDWGLGLSDYLVLGGSRWDVDDLANLEGFGPDAGVERLDVRNVCSESFCDGIECVSGDDCVCCSGKRMSVSVSA